MHGRLRAAALIVGLTALPLQQASPTFADSCEIVGNNGLMTINDGELANRSWRVVIDGVTYQSDTFDKLHKKTVSRTVKTAKKKITVRDTVWSFKDTKGITSTPNNGGVRSIDMTISGEVNESQDSGFVDVKNRTDNQTFRIEDPSSGLPINCG